MGPGMACNRIGDLQGSIPMPLPPTARRVLAAAPTALKPARKNPTVNRLGIGIFLPYRISFLSMEKRCTNAENFPFPRPIKTGRCRGMVNDDRKEPIRRADYMNKGGEKQERRAVPKKNI
jgi:hypothetical protein